MPELPYSLERTVPIRATPETVFRFFTDSARWATWWGAGSTIDAVPGGRVYIRHANGVEVTGEVLAVSAPDSIVFTYGYEGGKQLPAAGSSRVTIRLEPTDAGTRLHLLHEFAESSARDVHVQGWRFQLSLFGNVVANEAYAGAQAVVDAWFEAWQTADVNEREAILARTVTPSIRFRDRYSLLEGVADVSAHIGAALRFMPGIALRRKGDVRQCQGTVLADWEATGADGVARMSGTNVYEFSADGRIDSVTGLANG
jgi:uncharacterized protein YndB with AHSA1/START domain